MSPSPVASAQTFSACRALRPARRDHGLVRPDQLIEIIQDRRALDQRLAAVEHQRRHPAQRIIRRDLVALAEGRPRPVLERQIRKAAAQWRRGGRRGSRIGRSGSWRLARLYCPRNAMACDLIQCHATFCRKSSPQRKIDCASPWSIPHTIRYPHWLSVDRTVTREIDTIQHHVRMRSNRLQVPCQCCRIVSRFRAARSERTRLRER